MEDTKMKRFTKIAAGLTAAALMLSVTACSRSVSRSTKGYESDDVQTYEWATSETAAMAVENAAGDYGFEEAADYYDDYEYGEENYRSTQMDPSSDISSTSQSQLPANTMLIRRVTMNVETTDYNNVTNTVSAKVSELGGYIESSNASGTGNNGNLRNITYVIRVPIDKLDSLVNSVGSCCTVLSSSENTEDVTLQYSDIQARIRSLRVEQETLMNLLAQADSLEAVITLQNRLTEVRYEIESNESRARVLENQSAYSTLTLSVREVLEETEQIETKKLSFGEEIIEGLKESLGDIKDDAKDFVIGFVSALPYLLILAVIGLIIFFIIKAIIKSAKKKKAKKALAVQQKADVAKATAEADADKKEETKE